MIDAKTLRLITQNGLQAFAQGRILDGIAALKSLLPYCTNEAVICADAESLEKNYHYMLSFLRGGGDDEKRNEVQTKIQRSGISLIEQTGRKIRLHLNDDRYSEAFNRLQSTYSEPMSVLFEKWDSLLTPEERSDIQDDLFDLLWTSGFWTPQDLAFWYDFITEQHDMVQQHLTGALFLSIWEHYDGEKMQLLCLMAESECRRTHITAIAYLLLLRLRHKEVTALMPTLPECCLSRKKRLVADTCYEMLLMLLSEKDMKQELEEAERLSQELFSSKNSLNASNIKAIVTLKARYMQNRLQRGLDPNLAKAPLLHSCEYLRRIAHWFLPFDKNHPLFQSVMIDEKGNEKQKLSTLVDFILDCDVDKLAMLYLVANDKDFSKAALQLDKQELPDLENAAVPEYSLRFVIQDLFRFFVHSPLSSQLINPFREKLTLFDFPELAHLIPANESIACCELLLELEQPRQAIAVLNSVIEREGASASILLLKGQALLKTKQIADAISCTRSAELLEPENTDVLGFLAQCYGLQSRHEEVLEYLQKLAELMPEDKRVQKLIPLTMNKVGRKEEALKHLFKLDYESTENDDDYNEILSHIADTALSLGKLDIAERYTEKVLERQNGKDADALLRAGHIKLLQGDWKSSLDNYEQFVNLYCKLHNEDISSALSQWNKNREMLIEKGIKESDLLLVRDIIIADSNNSTQQTQS